ncbi:response regulator transcription factor [Microbacterium sp.]|jgi:DNA-binding response OmpR family regulator|uniref:response regulator transcription factor n=1 Tax=Microbacterium sp. TaxID=51671 RepID=UPI0037C63114
MRPIAAHPLSDPHSRSAIVIDHDPDHALALVTSLRQQGFTVREASDGFTGVALTQRHKPDLVVLSLELPGIDGFETTRRVRAFSDAFVMMLSDDDSESAAVEAFRAGSDDYIVKPYGPYALRARIDAIMRRSRVLQTATPVVAESDMLTHGSVRLWPGSRRVEVAGRDVELTRSEFDLLHTFMRARDQVFSKSSLALMLRESNGLSGAHITAHDRHAVEVHIMNLRRKLADDPRAPQCVETVRGFGYRLAPIAAATRLLEAAAG